MKIKKQITIISIVLLVLVTLVIILSQKNLLPYKSLIKDTGKITQSYPKYGHAKDFSWVSGILKYNTLEGGCWTLIFSQEPGKADAYYGILAIENASDYKYKLKDGDLVVLEGKVSGSKFSMACPPNLYLINNVIPN